MIRRGCPQRIVAGLLLFWFAWITGVPAAWHSCPVHDAASAAGLATASPEHGAGGEHVTHGSHGHQLPERGGDDECTCIGDCSANGVSPALPVVRSLPAQRSGVDAREPIPPRDAPALTTPEFARPYANGPPGPVRVL
jgi:hypothetical protein